MTSPHPSICLPWFQNSQYPLFLAPMAGVTDKVFRLLCKEMGADVMVTEFVSTEGILQAQERTRHYTEFSDEERPLGIQLFGADGRRMGQAARIIVDRDRPDFIDINFGCPVPKVVAKNGGSSLLKDVPLLLSVAKGVIEAVGNDVPVTAKIRLGWEQNNIVAQEVCQGLQDLGIRMVTIHGRTRSQGYSGEADWDAINACAQQATIPIIGNGDIRSVLDAQRHKEESCVAGLMIGRAAMETPWIFRDIKDYLATGNPPPPRTPEERWAFIFRHLDLALAVNKHGSTENTFKFMRSKLIAYSKGFPGAKEIRQRLARLASRSELEDIATHSINQEQCHFL